ncbi:MAG: RdgB/HAM1 family non-canonical purine NTP pyrophosphatase [Acutalibacteraceae bacterium]|nr:RdgB/HAM1 family non-canonical purine NTP pyrophosphatase [Acutalibacteraceae bacterium]
MKFFLASKNKHKIAEFSRILSPLGVEIISEADLDTPIDDVEETGTTFEENAFIKAEAAVNALGLPSIADDSGLCVDYLNGEPGIYSARFAGEPVDNNKNNQKLLSLLNGVEHEKRTAKFVCCIACVFPDGRRLYVTGECHGHIATEKIGNNGFGYDPLFISEIGCFGTLNDAEKDSVSHRGRALTKFSEIIGEYMKEV